MRNDDATLKNNVSSEYNYSNRDGRRSNREWIFDQAAIREMERTTIQILKSFRVALSENFLNEKKENTTNND